MYIQASIGRNYTRTGGNAQLPPGDTLSDTAWKNFQKDARDEIMLTVGGVANLDLDADNFQVHTGVGEWMGVKEESAHISIYFDTKPGQVNAARLHEHLSDRLSYLAFQYGQDAIAFIVTDSHLATR